MAEETRVSREELYEKVWTQPVRTVAKRLGVSDVALAKDCRRLKIPLPGRGYWAKKATGKKVRRIALPVLPPNDAVTPREKDQERCVAVRYLAGVVPMIRWNALVK